MFLLPLTEIYSLEGEVHIIKIVLPLRRTLLGYNNVKQFFSLDVFGMLAIFYLMIIKLNMLF